MAMFWALLGSAALGRVQRHHPGAEDGDPVAELLRFDEVVSGEEDRPPFFS